VWAERLPCKAHSAASGSSATLDWLPAPEDEDRTVLTQVCQCFIQRIRQLITHKSPKTLSSQTSWISCNPLLN
jgi:hypothetical protein